jgi:hypothetical protein
MLEVVLELVLAVARLFLCQLLLQGRQLVILLRLAEQTHVFEQITPHLLDFVK